MKAKNIDNKVWKVGGFDKIQEAFVDLSRSFKREINLSG